MTIGAASLFTTHAIAQSNGDMTQTGRDKKDSMETVALREVQTQSAKDKNRMAEAKLGTNKLKAKAENAQRIEKDANDAAHESRNAVRAERSAQKSHKQANKQAEKAAGARTRSNNN